MIREAQGKLLDWKGSKGRKPLVIRGARQVGKTWLMKEFGKTYENCVYINFDRNPRMGELFKGDISPSNILEGLEIESGTTIHPENTLIIFDEIQEVPRALTSLKYFCEDAPKFHIVAAGSLLGVALHGGTSFPVGKVSFLQLFPLNFLEFLRAHAGDKLVDALELRDWAFINSFHDKLCELLRLYLYIGGMPEVVKAFTEGVSLHELREIHLRIISSYENDFSKHAPSEIVPRIRLLWESLPAQLGRENKKFMYGLVKSGARAREYEMAMAWLLDCGLIHKVNRISKPALPIKSYEDLKAFKLYHLDVGLLGAMSGIDARAVLEGHRLFVEFKGSLTEQYVLQQMKTMGDIIPQYWSNDKGQSEVDFVIQYDNAIIPIEVKAEINLQAKSLQVYRQKFEPKVSVRLSLARFEENEGLMSLPLYALNRLFS